MTMQPGNVRIPIPVDSDVSGLKNRRRRSAATFKRGCRFFSRVSAINASMAPSERNDYILRFVEPLGPRYAIGPRFPAVRSQLGMGEAVSQGKEKQAHVKRVHRLPACLDYTVILTAGTVPYSREISPISGPAPSFDDRQFFKLSSRDSGCIVCNAPDSLNKCILQVLCTGQIITVFLKFLCCIQFAYPCANIV